MKSYYKIYSRKFRRKYYTVLVAVLTYAYNKVSAWYIEAKKELESIVNRPFRLAVMRNQPKFPVINAVTSTKQALKALGNPEPTSRDVAEALKRVDVVRGDGVLPRDPRELATKAETVLGLHRSMNNKSSEVEVVKAAETEAQLESEVSRVVEKLEEIREESKSAE